MGFALAVVAWGDVTGVTVPPLGPEAAALLAPAEDEGVATPFELTAPALTGLGLEGLGAGDPLAPATPGLADPGLSDGPGLADDPGLAAFGACADCDVTEVVPFGLPGLGGVFALGAAETGLAVSVGLVAVAPGAVASLDWPLPLPVAAGPGEGGGAGGFA